MLCTVGDGGLGMRMADIETCVRLRLAIPIVVFNDDGLSLIKVVQRKKGYEDYGVGYGHVDFAAAGVALGARGTTVRTLDGLAAAVSERPDRRWSHRHRRPRRSGGVSRADGEGGEEMSSSPTLSHLKPR